MSSVYLHADQTGEGTRTNNDSNTRVNVCTEQIMSLFFVCFTAGCAATCPLGQIKYTLRLCQPTLCAHNPNTLQELFSVPVITDVNRENLVKNKVAGPRGVYRVPSQQDRMRNQQINSKPSERVSCTDETQASAPQIKISCFKKKKSVSYKTIKMHNSRENLTVHYSRSTFFI